MVDSMSCGAMQFSAHFWFYRDSQLLSSALVANLLICSQLEKRHMILMLWQPEQSWRQLEQVAGDSKDFFPDNNSKPKLLSFNKKKQSKKNWKHSTPTVEENKLFLTHSKDEETYTPDFDHYTKKNPVWIVSAQRCLWKNCDKYTRQLPYSIICF